MKITKLLWKLSTLLICFFICFTLVACEHKKTSEDTQGYTAIQAPDTLNLSVDTSHINDITQIDQFIYLASDGGLEQKNIVTGEENEILSDSIAFVDNDGDYVYAAAMEKHCIYVIDKEGGVVETKEFGESDIVDPACFALSDDYFVFLDVSHDGDGKNSGQIFYIIDKKTMRVESVPSTASVTNIYSYKNNQILLYYYARNSTDCYVTSYNINLDSIGEKYFINILGIHDAVYDRYLDSLLIYTIDNVTFNMSLKKVDFKDGSVSSLISYPITGKSGVVGLCASANNIVCCAMSNSPQIQIYDFEQEYPSVTIALYGFPQSSLQYMLSVFKEEHQIDTNLIQYSYGDVDKLNLKLQAGDSDIDLYYTFGLDTAYYVKNNAYTDLKQYEALSDNFERCQSFIDASATYEGHIFGIPTEVFLFDSLTYKKADGDRQNNATYQYMGTYIDLTKSTYDDADGAALEKLMTYFLANPKDNADQPLYGDFRMLLSDYVMLNPNSKHKEEAVLFLNDLMELYLGNKQSSLTDYAAQSINLYPDETDYNGVLQKWKCYNKNVLLLILDGIGEVLDGADIKATTKLVHDKIDMAVKE